MRRASAASIFMPRCCRAGAEPRRSSARSWPATAETGIVIMQMDEGLDTGPVCIGERMPIGPDMTAGELHDELSLMGAKLIGRALERLAQNELSVAGRSPARARPMPPRSPRRRSGSTGTLPAIEVHNRIRALVALARRLVRGTACGPARAHQGAALGRRARPGRAGSAASIAADVACGNRPCALPACSGRAKSRCSARNSCAAFPLPRARISDKGEFPKHVPAKAGMVSRFWEEALRKQRNMSRHSLICQGMPA